jgi:S-adenosylmethionine decarboxylase
MVVACALWNLLIFGLLRSTWLEQRALLPFANLQALVASWYGGQASAPVVVSLECSGADVLALCAGFVLAFPSSWRRRLGGLSIILPFLVLLNIARIVTLSSAAASPSQFHLLHSYVWPAVFILAAVTMVRVWMAPARKVAIVSSRTLRIALYSFGAFVVAAPWIAPSIAVDRACQIVARMGALEMRGLGAKAVVTGAVLTAPRGSFVVTPDCILSPVIPLWIAAVFWLPLSSRGRVAGLLLTFPALAMLASLRLLVLAAPGAWVDSPILVVHGFHQMVLFAVLVLLSAWRGVAPSPSARRMRQALTRALPAIALSALVGLVVGPAYNKLLVAITGWVAHWLTNTIVTLRPPTDVQGVLVFLPVYQLLLLVALVSASGRRVRCGTMGVVLASLSLSHVFLLAGLGELQARGFHLHAILLRGWSALLPVMVAMYLLRQGRHRSSGMAETRAYRSFWDDVGAEFPDLSGARSTILYREGEQRLIRRYLPDLPGKQVFKTDLWDEARNTHILQWIEQQGAQVFGIDISHATLARARREFHGRPLRAVGADVRALPFRDGSFDAIYSMGTIEHFEETEKAVEELFRVLKPGGRAIIGVPNRHDPFLRPLMVAVLYRLGWYGYGFEKSYSRASLRRMLVKAGFTFVADDGLLFIPGWLRMLDLLCHTRFPGLARLTGTAVEVFRWIERGFPSLHRRGYLIAAIVERPHLANTDRRFSVIGREWIVDAIGCNPQALRSRELLQSLFSAIIADTELHVVGQPMWHIFPGEAGITGLQGLAESHLACHTYPEAGYAAFSLYCCRPDVKEWPWREHLVRALEASDVNVRVVSRGPASPNQG